jgi:hypothetical protein
MAPPTIARVLCGFESPKAALPAVGTGTRVDTTLVLSTATLVVKTRPSEVTTEAEVVVMTCVIDESVKVVPSTTDP